MSKTGISRVKYPKKSEIHNQINTIIEESHMFEQEQSQTGYVQCKRVKRSFFSSDAATVLIAAAACVIVVLCVVPFFKSGTRRSQALSNPGEVSTQPQYDPIDSATQPVSPDVNCTITSQAVNVIEDGSLYKVYMTYHPYKATVNGVEFNQVYNLCEERKGKMWNILYEKYVSPQSSMTETDIDSVYASNLYLKSYTDMKDLLAIDSQYSVKTQMKENADGTSKRDDYVYMQADTFDMKNEKLLTYEDILKDYDAAFDIMADYIYKATKENISLGYEGIKEAYMSKDSIKEKLKTSSSWRLSKNGIQVFCNDYRSYNSMIYNTDVCYTTYETFVFDFDKYDIIKDDYKS